MLSLGEHGDEDGQDRPMNLSMIHRGHGGDDMGLTDQVLRLEKKY